MGVSCSKFSSCYKVSKPCISTKNGEVVPRAWSDLPPDILLSIAERLGLIELLSFRGVCKDWLFASATASAQIESSPNHEPWFLLQKENSLCLLCGESKMYSINIPELQEATCISSNQGWLLLFQKGSIFFFCPFSRAKINLPQFPHSEFSDHVAAFSSPPTSQECIVSVMNQSDQFTWELNVLQRGADEWTKHEFKHSQRIQNAMACATYHNGTFYFLDSQSRVVAFSVKEKNWVAYRLVLKQKVLPNELSIPFSSRRNYMNNMKEFSDLEGDVSILTCGTLIRYDHSADVFIHNETVNPIKPGCRCYRGIWIHPRFHHVPPTQSWSL